MCLIIPFDFTEDTRIDGVFFCVSEKKKWLQYDAPNGDILQLTDRAQRAIAAFEKQFFGCQKQDDTPKKNTTSTENLDTF